MFSCSDGEKEKMFGDERNNAIERILRVRRGEENVRTVRRSGRIDGGGGKGKG